MYYTYMLRCGDGSLYTGYTNDLKNRILKHVTGKGAKYTKSHVPMKLVHVECFLDQSEAMRREAAIKKCKKNEKENLCDIEVSIVDFGDQEGRNLDIVQKLLFWYGKNKRSFPWRDPIVPYRIWICEIMSQQTRMMTVVPYYESFLKRFPDVINLANASEAEVLKTWEGMGYYSRARNLHKAAQYIVNECNGLIPKTVPELKKMPGVGEYTAGAIASIAFGQSTPAVDGNVLRVVSRMEGIGDDIIQSKTRYKVTEIVRKWIPCQQASDFTQAMMELGAVICTPKQSLCLHCPVAQECFAFSTNLVEYLPYKRAFKKQKQVQRVLLLLQDENGHWLLRKRKQRLLCGLWEFPAWDYEKNGAKKHLKRIIEEWGLPINQLITVGYASHIFTHLHWKMEGFYAKIQETSPLIEGFEWREESIFESEAWPIALKYYRDWAIRRIK